MSPLAFGMTPKMKPLSPRRSAVVAALDVGTSKTTCLIARLTPHPPQEVLRRRTHAIEVVGFSHTESRGMKAGCVGDLAEAEIGIRHAVDLAEKSARCQAESVVVSLSGGRPGSETHAASVDVPGRVRDGDMSRACAVANRLAERGGRVMLHSIPIGFSIDGERGIREPRSMLARELGVDLHVLTADAAAAHNLMLAVESCHLDVEALVAAPYAAALSVLADDEAEVGAVVVDVGAGTTTLAVFSRGRFVYADGFALGGRHVTLDLARGLGTTVPEAERIKTLHGNVLGGALDDRDTIAVAPVPGDDREPSGVVSRAMLTRIIAPRVEEILEMVRDRLAASPFASEPNGRVVVTGGASELTGFTDLAARVLERPVRTGRPLGIAGLPDGAKGAAFAVAAGLLVYPQVADLEHFDRARAQRSRAGQDGYLTRVGRWLRESF